MEVIALLIMLILTNCLLAAGDASEMRRTLIFVNGRRDCDLIAFYLSGQGIPCASINGDRGQHLREEALNSFRRRKVVALVATDVLARGIDIHDLDHVSLLF